jgi:hypothetical protein
MSIRGRTPAADGNVLARSDTLSDVGDGLVLRAFDLPISLQQLLKHSNYTETLFHISMVFKYLWIT